MRLALCVILSCGSLFANSQILSNIKKEQFELERRQNELTSNQLKYSWLSPVVGSYSHDKKDGDTNTTSKHFQISLDQPIFKSGGIYFGIKGADANREYLAISTQLSFQTLIKDAMMLVLSYRKLNYQINTVKLQIDNAVIDILRKKEQYESGQVDSSDLDQAMLSKNQLEHTLLELQRNLIKSVQDFEAISDKDIENVEIQIGRAHV